MCLKLCAFRFLHQKIQRLERRLGIIRIRHSQLTAHYSTEILTLSNEVSAPLDRHDKHITKLELLEPFICYHSLPLPVTFPSTGCYPYYS